MKSIDIKSLIIGALLTSTIFLGAADGERVSPNYGIAEERPNPAELKTEVILSGATKTQPHDAGSWRPFFKIVWPLFVVIVLVGGQILYVKKGPSFNWPDLFRALGTLSFAVFALQIAAISLGALGSSPSVLGVIEVLLSPFTGFVSCYLIAHLLETFNMIRENTRITASGGEAKEIK